MTESTINLKLADVAPTKRRQNKKKDSREKKLAKILLYVFIPIQCIDSSHAVVSNTSVPFSSKNKFCTDS